MNRRVILHSEAEAEILDALAWYNQRSRLAGRAFVQELTYALRLVTRKPQAWPRSFGGTRRFVFPTFPFDLVYRRKREVIEIVALAHHRRRPYYWRKR